MIRFAICLMFVLAVMCATAPPVEAACGIFGGRGLFGIRGRIQDRQAAREASSGYSVQQAPAACAPAK